MKDTTRPDMTLYDAIGGGTPINIAHEVAEAMGVTMQSMCTTRLGGISADQLRALCVTIHRSADEILNTGMNSMGEEERWLLHVWRTTDERGRRMISALAESLQGWTEGSSLRVIDGVPRS